MTRNQHQEVTRIVRKKTRKAPDWDLIAALYWPDFSPASICRTEIRRKKGSNLVAIRSNFCVFVRTILVAKKLIEEDMKVIHIDITEMLSYQLCS